MSHPKLSRGATTTKRPGEALAELKVFLRASPMLSAYLEKRSVSGAWQRRFFELRGPFLCYYPKKYAERLGVTAPPAPHGAIDLRRMGSAEIIASSSSQQRLWSLSSSRKKEGSSSSSYLLLRSLNGTTVALRRPAARVGGGFRRTSSFKLEIRFKTFLELKIPHWQ